MASASKTLVVIGSGPGIGTATASLFASEGFSHIALLSRNKDRLQDTVKTVQQAAASASNSAATVKSWAVDIADPDAYSKALTDVLTWSKEADSRLQCVLFNAARVQESDILTTPLEDVEYEFKITNSALLTTVRSLVPTMLELAGEKGQAAPSFFVTNSILYRAPSPQHFALSLTKAAQRTLVMSLKDAYESRGIHFALISVGGVVDPESNENLSPKGVARKVWTLFQQSKYPRYEWEWDLEVQNE